MKSLFACLLLLLTTGTARAQQALLWLPAQTSGAEELIALLENDNNLRLTAAFTELPKALADRVRKLENDKRLELVLRPEGDPPLPLLYYPAEGSVKWEGKPSTSAFASNNQYFLGLRLGLARDAAMKVLKKIPAGLAVPPGGVLEDYFPLAKALGAKWLACGPFASTAAAVLEADGVAAVPFVSFSTYAAAPEQRFVVFDETSSSDPAGLRAALAAALKSAPKGKSLTVSEAVTLSAGAAAAPAEIAAAAAPWSGDYGRWASAPAQAGALAALAKTRGDLMLHLNACQGDYKTAKPAFDEYFSAEDGRKLIALASPDEEAARETEIEMRSALGNSYRLMHKTPPPWVFSSLAEAAESSETSERLQVSLSASGFEIRNLPSKPVLAAPPADLPKGADPYKIWKLERFAAAVEEDAVVFRFYPAEIENSRGLPSGFGRVTLDLYIDINHRARAGISSLLGGRPLRLFPENAWEYALEITPFKASLYAAKAKNPAVVATVKPETINGAITVRLPRSALIGNPLLWGYAALMLAPRDAKNFTIADHIAAGIDNGYIYAVRPGKK
ncbi:MAG TPA: hypothetical protein DCZ92_12350 [Elusimicrobia bacterium]|nr:MAG: hypothetical protein A2016_09335 [Elusimicrobia bacterium GWF2_62_30]HBA61580.1 hypothetical protein [Elusimicrobiota bacterium]